LTGKGAANATASANAKLPQNSRLVSPASSTSPIAQPVRQCTVALKANFFIDMFVPSIDVLLSPGRVLRYRAHSYLLHHSLKALL
jgi:hypothetical protein